MSSPLGGTSPINIPVGGTLDASGSISKTIPIRAAYWCVVKVVLSAAGNPTWTAKLGGVVVGIGQGSNSEMGPFLVPPQQQLTLIGVNGQAGAPVSGSITGKQSPSQDAIADHWSPSPNTVSLLTTAQQQLLKVQDSDSGLYTISDTALHTLTFRIPPNSLSLRFLTQYFGASITTYTVVGDATGSVFGQYVNHSGISAFSGQSDETKLNVGLDATLIATIQLTAGSIQFAFQASTIPTFLSIRQNSGDLLNVAVPTVNPTRAYDWFTTNTTSGTVELQRTSTVGKRVVLGELGFDIVSFPNNPAFTVTLNKTTNAGAGAVNLALRNLATNGAITADKDHVTIGPGFASDVFNTAADLSRLNLVIPAPPVNTAIAWYAGGWIV